MKNTGFCLSLDVNYNIESPTIPLFHVEDREENSRNIVKMKLHFNPASTKP